MASVEGAKVSISDTCFTNNIFSGKGVVVIEGSEADFTASNVFGTTDEKLSCPFTSIRDESCVDYDSATCSAVNAFVSGSTSTTEDSTTPTEEADTAKNASSSFSIEIGFYAFLLPVVVTAVLGF